MDTFISKHRHAKRLSAQCFFFFICAFVSCQNSKNYLNKSYKTLTEIDLRKEWFYPNTYCFVPDATRMKILEDSIHPMKYPISESALKEQFHEIDAIEYIAKQAEQHRLVILNESHHYPSHRMFATKLLPELKKRGYKYLGIEALMWKKHFKQPEYAYISLGYYTRQPTFGNFIRKAIELGFEIFPYQSKSSGFDREKEQAQHIADYLRGKQGKALIYSSYGHCYEKIESDGNKYMGGYISDFMGIDPLTVNQTQFNHSDFIEGQEAKVFINPKNEPFKQFNDCDVFVFHPNYNYSNNRVNWKLTTETKWIPVTTAYLPDNYPLLAVAYKNEAEFKKGVIPLDIVEIQSANETEWLCVSREEGVAIYLFNRKRKILLISTTEIQS